MIGHRENFLKAAFFQGPAYIPVSFHINAACYHHYSHDFLFGQIERHPLLFPDFKRPAAPFTPHYGGNATAGVDYVDSFGCVWRTSDNGITGTVVRHPLESWDSYKAYPFPSPEDCNGLEPVDWTQVGAGIRRAKERGELIFGGLRHGHTFLQLSDIRGYFGLLADMADEEPLLDDLVTRLEAFNLAIIEKYLSFGVDVITYPEDLGVQKGPMLSPAQFRRYIRPSYERLMAPARQKGVPIHMHSDGDIRDLWGDLLLVGGNIINLQDLVNGIGWIRDNLKGRICIDLDVDRQLVTPFGTPAEVDALIKNEVETLGSPEGGLCLIYGLYPGVPEENVVALMDAMERYAFYYS